MCCLQAIADAEQKKASADEKLTEQSERILQLQNELDAVRGEVENVKREKELHYQYFTAESSSKQEALRQVSSSLTLSACSVGSSGSRS